MVSKLVNKPDTHSLQHSVPRARQTPPNVVELIILDYLLSVHFKQGWRLTITEQRRQIEEQQRLREAAERREEEERLAQEAAERRVQPNTVLCLLGRCHHSLSQATASQLRQM